MVRLGSGQLKQALPLLAPLPQAVSLHGVLLAFRAIAVPLCIAAFGLFLRTYDLQLMGWVPDTYERLTATQRLLRGEFPLSVVPPGVSFVMAPFFLVLPQTVETMQAVTVGAAIGLVLLAYVATLKLTGDKLAAVLFALVLAISPAYVYASRDGLYDIIVTFLVAVAVFGLPALRGRGVWAFVAYGFVLATLVNVRASNGACFPALGLYWLYLNGGPSRRSAWKSLISCGVGAAAITVVGITVGSVALGGWFGNAAEVPVRLDSVGANLAYYAKAIAGDAPGIILLLPLAVAGGSRLWRLDRGLCVAVLTLLVLWPLAVSPFHFHMARYILPAKVFFFFLAALGPREVWRLTGSLHWPARVTLHVYTGLALATTAVLFVYSSGLMLNKWDKIAARSDAGLARELRPALDTLQANSLIVTAVGGPFRSMTEHVEYYDLIDHWMQHGSGGGSQALLSAEVETALSEGRRVYYIYSRWEAGDDFQGDGLDNFLSFFETIQANFNAVKVLDAPTLNLGKYVWTLYKVEAK